MLVLRCTRKLLAHIGPPVADPPPLTTLLGDWFAQPVAVGRQRFVLLISEHSRQPVLMRGRDVKHFVLNFPDALAAVLRRLHVPPAAIEQEVEACRKAVIAVTNSRSILCTLNDFSNLLWHRLQNEPNPDLTDLALWLGDTPVGPLGPGWRSRSRGGSWDRL